MNLIKDWIDEDKGLYHGNRYVHWEKGRQCIQLRGSFTFDELAEIIQYMRDNMAPRDLGA